MARPLRIEYPGAVYHVTSRGNARNKIFSDNQDREILLSILGAVVKRYNWLCHAYCLMDNHLILETTPKTNLSKLMKQINLRYASHFRRRNRYFGHLWEGRFKSLLVERDRYLSGTCSFQNEKTID